EIRKVELSFHFFPEDNNTGATTTESQKLFYPNFQTKQLSHKFSAAAKRTLDIIGSLAALVILSPAFLAIAIGIRMTSTGPALFRQERLRKNGKPFTFLKFLSMYVPNDPHLHRQYVENLIHGNNNGTSERVYKIKDDPRVTRFGYLLRVSSLD